MPRPRIAFLVAGLAACSPAGGGTPTTGEPTTSTTSGSTTGTSGTTAATTDGMTDTGTASGGSTTTGGPSCTPMEGECRKHEDCPTGYCEAFSSAPPDPDAACAPALPEGQIRLTGTVRDFEARTRRPGRAARS